MCVLFSHRPCYRLRPIQNDEVHRKSETIMTYQQDEDLVIVPRLQRELWACLDTACALRVFKESIAHCSVSCSISKDGETAVDDMLLCCTDGSVG